jgi:hypothetical protein
MSENTHIGYGDKIGTAYEMDWNKRKQVVWGGEGTRGEDAKRKQMKRELKWCLSLFFLRLLHYASGQWTHDQLNTRWKQKSVDIFLFKYDSLYIGFFFNIKIIILELQHNFWCSVIRTESQQRQITLPVAVCPEALKNFLFAQPIDLKSSPLFLACVFFTERKFIRNFIVTY